MSQLDKRLEVVQCLFYRWSFVVAWIPELRRQQKATMQIGLGDLGLTDAYESFTSI